MRRRIYYELIIVQFLSHSITAQRSCLLLRDPLDFSKRHRIGIAEMGFFFNIICTVARIAIGRHPW